MDQKTWGELSFDDRSRYIAQLQSQARQSDAEYQAAQAAYRAKEASMNAAAGAISAVIGNQVLSSWYCAMNANLPYGPNPYGAQNATPQGPYESGSMNQKLQSAKDWLASRNSPTPQPQGV